MLLKISNLSDEQLDNLLKFVVSPNNRAVAPEGFSFIDSNERFTNIVIMLRYGNISDVTIEVGAKIILACKEKEKGLRVAHFPREFMIDLFGVLGLFPLAGDGVGKRLIPMDEDPSKTLLQNVKVRMQHADKRG